MIGDFEYLVLAAAAHLGDAAYGLTIRQHIETFAERSCSPGALYTTLDRLERKGLILTWMGDATPRRGGRAKRLVQLTAKGRLEAKTFYDAITAATLGVSWEAARAKR